MLQGVGFACAWQALLYRNLEDHCRSARSARQCLLSVQHVTVLEALQYRASALPEEQLVQVLAVFSLSLVLCVRQTAGRR